MTRQTEIVYGPPGTGKTEYLLQIVERYLKNGYNPEEIGFVSFSRRAIGEAISRITERVSQHTSDNFIHFRTIHATAYHLLNLTREDVFTTKHLSIFGQLAGLEFRNGADDEGQPWEGTVGDKCLTIIHNSRARGTRLELEWRRANLDNLPWNTLKFVAGKYQKFKEQNGLWDFSDMIERAKDYTLNGIKILVVDESQDTNTSQWNMLRAISKDVEHVHLAGDDDQSIYGWSGADATMLYRLGGIRTVLPRSWRLPNKIKSLADSITARISQRYPKVYSAREADGEVRYIPNVEFLNLKEKPNTWLLIARNNYQLQELRNLARSQGVIYSLPNGKWSWSLPYVRAAVAYEKLRKGHSIGRIDAKHILSYLNEHRVKPNELPDNITWINIFGDRGMDKTWMEALTALSLSDKEYIRALRRSGESLTEQGRIRIGTAHSVKGAQADNVAILTDIGAKVAHGAIIDPDAELRVQYVAATRAKNKVFIVDPQSQYFWSFN